MPKQALAKKPHRPLSEIAAEILQDINSGVWSKHAAFYAAPYLAAMRGLNSISDNYYSDTAESVVLYFLSNASTWRGDNARRIKAELKGMVA